QPEASDAFPHSASRDLSPRYLGRRETNFRTVDWSLLSIAKASIIEDGGNEYPALQVSVRGGFYSE
ncbi:MAG: hypothetical protein ACI9JU_002318, partial [Pseudohongiellaceae bacterium]